jgi:hypothetical protein
VVEDEFLWGATGGAARLGLRLEDDGRWFGPIRLRGRGHRLVIGIENVSREPELTFEESLALLHYRVEVRGPDGAAAPFTDEGSRLQGCTEHVRCLLVTLGPGERHEESYELSAWHDLPAGRLEVRVERASLGLVGPTLVIDGRA